LPYIKDESFLLTYGDGVTDSDINESIVFHNQQQKILTMTAVQPAGRFGDMEIADDRKVTAFKEKPEKQSGYINGGFFVVDKRISEYLGDDTCVFENEPMTKLAEEKQIVAYLHRGFWQCMDTYREQQLLTGLWNSNKAPWKVW
jgi:glucose-1-phosphate cytidylyltransferase